MSFTQKANGIFCVPVVPGTPHCGINDESLCSCAYRVSLEYDDTALDQNGFLLDNTAFRDYFASLASKPITISCENLARQICNDLCALCNHRAYRTTVALSPFDGVEVSFTYHRDNHAVHASVPVDFSMAGDYAELA